MTEPSLEHVAAELAVRNVVARLAQLADAGDTEGYLALLTDDIVWEMPPNPAIGLAASRRRGHAEIGAGQRDRMAAGHQGPGSATRHLVSTVWVDVAPDARTARSESAFQFVGSTTEHPTVLNIGSYADELRLTADGWKLAHRTITFG